MDAPAFTFHHGGVSVPDLEQAITWYRDILGFALERRFRIEPAKADVAFVRRGTLRFELFEVADAAPLPLPREDYPMFVENTRLAFGPDRARGVPAHQALIAYGVALADTRRRNPGDDLVSRIVTAEFEGRRLTDQEVGGFVSLLIGAGAETTGSTIAAGLSRLYQHPEQWRMLRQDRSMLPNAVNEILRHASAVINFRRNATDDVELGGQRIKRGEKVVLFYESANFDETVFADPERFDITRPEGAKQVSFGAGGPHQCLGEQLGKREIAVFLDRLLDRVERIEITVPLQRTHSPRFNMAARYRGTFHSR